MVLQMIGDNAKKYQQNYNLRLNFKCTETNRAYVDKERSFQWLQSAGLKGGTEGFITAAQDQAQNTKYYQNKIQKTTEAPKRRLCHEYNETVEHITSGCPIL